MKTVRINEETFRVVTDVTSLRFTNVVIDKGYLNLIYTQDYLKDVYEHERVILRVKL